ncbi:kinase-like domain-containing protein [Rhizophagus clarus]|uniref:Kinase-like domain-containing protein n=1 Tax=Rhizophagus clarus TaxID=94130 RepID=A0A8H3QF17_9GLOM|nr:kinase-like domain-containing protein [Rhizophagus clarus]
MDYIREDIIFAACHRAYALTDYNIQVTMDKRFEFRRQTILADKSLTKDEKSYAIKILNEDFDKYKILLNEGTKRICGYSEIYGAYWIDGRYDEWNSKEKQLKRKGGHDVVLKKLENVENANRSWFDESKFHLSISNKYSHIVRCYGLTKNPLDGNYMLVLFELNNNLKEYLQQNYNKLTWEKRIQIINDIVPDINTLYDEIYEMNRLNYQNELNENNTDENNKIGMGSIETHNIISTSGRLFTSKIYQFKNLPEPKNATEGEQEAFHSKPYDFSIPYNIEDFDNKSNNNTSESINILKDYNEKLTKIFDNIQINSNNDNQNNYKEVTIQQVKKHNIDDIDDDEMYDTSNFHSEEQDEFEIPNGN